MYIVKKLYTLVMHDSEIMLKFLKSSHKKLYHEIMHCNCVCKLQDLKNRKLWNFKLLKKNRQDDSEMSDPASVGLLTRTLISTAANAERLVCAECLKWIN